MKVGQEEKIDDDAFDIGENGGCAWYRQFHMVTRSVYRTRQPAATKLAEETETERKV